MVSRTGSFSNSVNYLDFRPSFFLSNQYWCLRNRFRSLICSYISFFSKRCRNAWFFQKIRTALNWQFSSEPTDFQKLDILKSYRRINNAFLSLFKFSSGFKSIETRYRCFSDIFASVPLLFWQIKRFLSLANLFYIWKTFNLLKVSY